MDEKWLMELGLFSEEEAEEIPQHSATTLQRLQRGRHPFLFSCDK